MYVTLNAISDKLPVWFQYSYHLWCPIPHIVHSIPYLQYSLKVKVDLQGDFIGDPFCQWLSGHYIPFAFQSTECLHPEKFKMNRNGNTILSENICDF